MQTLQHPLRSPLVGRLLSRVLGPVRVQPPQRDIAPGRPAKADRGKELHFVARVHRLRTLGLGLGFFCVASVLRLRDPSAVWWVLLFLNGFVWPHVALLVARRSSSPVEAEFRSLAIDSALGGMWVAVMEFNILPSALLVTMLSVDKMSAGGGRLLLRTSVLLAGACLLTSAALGFPVDAGTPMSVIVACLPFLVLYPLAISNVTYALAREVVRANRRLITIGRTDELTGLANRRQGFAIAEAELARHRRTGRPAMLLVLDVDYFKRINDRYGHPIGDDVLRRVATVLYECCRATDTPARYGGDEFMVVLPEADLLSIEGMARRIRKELGACVFERHDDLHCTVSIGVAEANADMVDVEDWIQQADAALYRAKAAGRDCVIAAPAPIGAA